MEFRYIFEEVRSKKKIFRQSLIKYFDIVTGERM